MFPLLFVVCLFKKKHSFITNIPVLKTSMYFVWRIVCLFLLLLFLKWIVVRSKPEHTGYPYYPRHFYIHQIVHNAWHIIDL
jgi:hypothetical protein